MCLCGKDNNFPQQKQHLSVSRENGEKNCQHVSVPGDIVWDTVVCPLQGVSC